MVPTLTPHGAPTSTHYAILSPLHHPTLVYRVRTTRTTPAFHAMAVVSAGNISP
jgi:hypothetical protein